MAEDIKNLNTSWPLPSNKQPIILVGAGGIVNDAHLPAYKKSGFDVQGIFDPIKEKSEITQGKRDPSSKPEPFNQNGVADKS